MTNCQDLLIQVSHSVLQITMDLFPNRKATFPTMQFVLLMVASLLLKTVYSSTVCLRYEVENVDSCVDIDKDYRKAHLHASRALSPLEAPPVLPLVG